MKIAKLNESGYIEFNKKFAGIFLEALNKLTFEKCEISIFTAGNNYIVKLNRTQDSQQLRESIVAYMNV